MPKHNELSPAEIKRRWQERLKKLEASPIQEKINLVSFFDISLKNQIHIYKRYSAAGHNDRGTLKYISLLWKLRRELQQLKAKQNEV